MKESLKSLKVWIIGIAISIFAVALPFIIFIICKYGFSYEQFIYPIMHIALAASLVIIGFVSGDIYIIHYRQKTKNWEDDLPMEIRIKSWKIKSPLYIGAATVFSVFLVFQMMYFIVGHYPLLLNLSF